MATAWTPPDFLPDGVWLYRDGHRDEDWYLSRIEPMPRIYPTDHYWHKSTEVGSWPVKYRDFAALFGVRFRELVMPTENKVLIRRKV